MDIENQQNKIDSELFPSSLGKAYKEYKPGFYAVLARLLRKGHHISSLLEGNDLIHDFFLEKWNLVKENFDEHKGNPKPYIYRSFTNFAIARIGQLNRYRSLTTDFEDIKKINTDTHDLPSEKISSYDIQRFRKAIDMLSEEDQQVLFQFFASSRPSFRKLAQKNDISRYEAQKRLFIATANLLFRFEKPDSISTEDWKTSKLVLDQQFSIEQAGQYLNVTNHQARQANARTLRTIAQLYRKT